MHYIREWDNFLLNNPENQKTRDNSSLCGITEGELDQLSKVKKNAGRPVWSLAQKPVTGTGKLNPQQPKSNTHILRNP